ncbi:MAG: hypothetical protein JSR46_02635 [Verrucomicrobia bacterium]|nr:hypothetical protein [Verrucomicrobiota bacterium]
MDFVEFKWRNHSLVARSNFVGIGFSHFYIKFHFFDFYRTQKMEAAPVASLTKAEFLRQKMTNLMCWLWDKLEVLRLKHPELLTYKDKEEMTKAFNTFKDEEEKLLRDGALFDQTKHFCLMATGGVEFDLEGNNLVQAQNIMFARKIVTIIVAQLLTAQQVTKMVEEKKKTGEIPVDEEIDLTNPGILAELIPEQNRIELQAKIVSITKELLPCLADADWLRICAYINCFTNTVTNL